MPFEKKKQDATPAKQEDKFAPETIVFETLDQNPQSHKVVSTDTIICPETGKARKIRLANGASTIYMDEMQPFELELPLVDLIFFDRKLEVNAKTEDQKLEYLRLTDQNLDKDNRLPYKKPAVFKEVKPLADVKARRSKLELQNKAETLATSCTDEEMFPFAHVLGINTRQDADFVRVDFIEVARIRPDYFLKYFDNPKNTKQYHVSLGLDKDLVRVEGGVAKWTASGKKITEVPVDKEIRSFLADYAGTDDGKLFYDALQKLL